MKSDIARSRQQIARGRRFTIVEPLAITKLLRIVSILINFSLDLISNARVCAAARGLLQDFLGRNQ